MRTALPGRFSKEPILTASPATASPGNAAQDGAAPAEMAEAASVDPAEIGKFEAMAEAWWDPDGKFRPLHRFNPVRLAYIRDRACRHFGRDPEAGTPLDGLALLDIGCGGGLLSEPMARLGANVVGIDAASRNIAVAKLHAERMGLKIDYRCATAEALAEAGRERFDIVLNMEVVEHVANVRAFLDASLKLLRPGGMMVIATLNRTLKSYALAILGAEYLLGWLPRGTHDWNRFLRPSELVSLVERAGGRVAALDGVVYNPLTDSWRLARDLDVNYMALVEPAAKG
jgi:2-polyprenyl-6-hydroxyphenyl methylase/3-demethylubiquinone-9 3-methyltransferase